jgi:hypothetical protein
MQAIITSVILTLCVSGIGGFLIQRMMKSFFKRHDDATAKSEIGYLDKRSLAQLDDKTAGR